ncbi:MAG: DUF4878 domain-containing protein [Ferruginibacter sp.]|nr:DUF4878 domain-containing protein [Ferruginibacter sp.]
MNKLIIAFFLLFAFAACKDEPSTPPTVVLDSMFAEMKNGNIEGMKKHITRTDAALLDAAEKFLTAKDPENVQKIKARLIEKMKEESQNIQYTLKNEKVDGDHATVEAEIVVKDTAAKDGKKVITRTLELVKEGNAWKIPLSKPGNEMFNSMKGNMGARDGGLEEGLEKIQKMNEDTLKMLIKKGAQIVDSMDIKKKTP